MSKAKLENVRIMLGYVRSFLIDEISMVSHLQLSFIHQRLQNIFGDFKTVYSFANMSIVAFGDLFMLPPVSKRPVFSNITFADAKKASLTIVCINLW